MNYTQSFEEFSSSLGPTDLALYAGVGIVLYVLFKDKLSPVQKMLMELFNNAKNTVTDLSKPSATVTVNVPKVTPTVVTKEDSFFALVTSWKQTRDLAEQHKCDNLVQVLDSSFGYLAPNTCNKTE